eukprot:gene14117-13909_t
MPNNSPEMLPELTADEPVSGPGIDLDTRRHQIFPTLSESDVKHMLRFGTVRQFADGEWIFRAGQTSFGLVLVLQGQIEVSRYDGLGNTAHITFHQAGQFGGEVAQLSGRPSLANGRAVGDTEVLLIQPESLRALLIAHADLGERIVRALILR